MSKKEKNREDIENQAAEAKNAAATEAATAEATTTADEAAQEAENAEPTEADKLQEMGEKLAAMNDKYIHLVADFENFRKRNNAEKAELVLNGGRDVIKSLLPIIDDLERALEATKMDEGVKLIYDKLIKVLGQKGLKAMEAKGEKFDMELHEAITRIPAADEEQKNTVVDVVEKGYYLNDKVLRYAKVVVAC